MPTSLLAPLLLAAGLLAGCGGGADCDALPSLTARRDQVREQFAALVARQEAGDAVRDDEVDVLHDRMHALDGQTYDLAAGCDRS